MMERIKDYDQWQRRFYEAYESENYDLAVDIYTSWFDFHEKTPDVHAGYKLQKKGDRKKIFIIIAALFILGVIFYWTYR